MYYLKAIAFSFTITAFLSSGTLAAEDLVHVVEKGETVYAISRSYSVTPEELMRFNNITDASRLQVGIRLMIPASVSTSSPQAFAEYRVVKNDTLYGIARTHGINIQTLLDLNGFSKSHVIKIGDRIKVPVSENRTGAVLTETVQIAAPVMPVIGSARQLSSTTVDPSLRWPVKPQEISYMTGKLFGVIVQGERSESVKNMVQGTVLSAGPYRGFGRVVIVEASGGYLYVYGGCESLSVKEGDRVGPGEELGKLGIDMLMEKPNLFFMVYRGNSPIDPAKAPRA